MELLLLLLKSTMLDFLGIRMHELWNELERPSIYFGPMLGRRDADS